MPTAAWVGVRDAMKIGLTNLQNNYAEIGAEPYFSETRVKPISFGSWCSFGCGAWFRQELFGPDGEIQLQVRSHPNR